MSRFSKLELPDDKGRDVASAAPSGEPIVRNPLATARELLRQGSYDGAMRYYSRALGDDSKLEEAWLGQLTCLTLLGEYQETITWADRALSIIPGSGDLLAAKAVAWGRLGDSERALGFSDSALATPSAGPFSWWARGDVMLMRDARAAEHCFAKAVEAAKGGPEQTRMPLFIGQTYLASAKPVEARKWLARAVIADRDCAVAYHYLGLACRQTGEDSRALEAFHRALGLRPQFAAAREQITEMSRRGLIARALSGMKRLFS